MDDIDRAADLERHQRQQALQRQKERSKEQPQWIEDGKVWCIDCGTEIRPERLKVKPDAARCIDCQRIHEQKEQHHAG
ncbi:MAG: conjugal transfer protein TraR [Oleibacter sp.]|nr:conjugal transfer protein TraR [Thalassolituus sp.]|tara:strand:- start:503 stop:736 length:234 start_codon:yes stop_codon:yes gene_type:complete